MVRQPVLKPEAAAYSHPSLDDPPPSPPVDRSSTKPALNLALPPLALTGLSATVTSTAVTTTLVDAASPRPSVPPSPEPPAVPVAPVVPAPKKAKQSRSGPYRTGLPMPGDVGFGPPAHALFCKPVRVEVPAAPVRVEVPATDVPAADPLGLGGWGVGGGTAPVTDGDTSTATATEAEAAEPEPEPGPEPGPEPEPIVVLPVPDEFKEAYAKYKPKFLPSIRQPWHLSTSAAAFSAQFIPFRTLLKTKIAGYFDSLNKHCWDRPQLIDEVEAKLFGYAASEAEFIDFTELPARIAVVAHRDDEERDPNIGFDVESWTPLRYDEAQRRLKNLAFCGSSSYSSQAAESTPRAVLVTTNKARFGSLQHSHTKTSEESGALGALLGMNEPYVEATKEKEGGVDGDGDGGGGKKRKLEAAVPVPAGSLQYNYDNTKLFKCDHCLYSSNYKNHFEKHVTSIHFPEKHRYYYCEVEGCIHRAKQGTDLKKHQKNIHNIGEVIIYKCELSDRRNKSIQCKYSSKYKADLARHMKSHVGVVRSLMYQCKVDGCEFLTKNARRAADHSTHGVEYLVPMSKEEREGLLKRKRAEERDRKAREAAVAAESGKLLTLDFDLGELEGMGGGGVEGEGGEGGGEMFELNFDKVVRGGEKCVEEKGAEDKGAEEKGGEEHLEKVKEFSSGHHRRGEDRVPAIQELT